MTVIFYLVFASDGFTNRVLSLNICHWHSAFWGVRRSSDKKCCETVKLTKYPCILINTWITVKSRTVAFHQNFSAGIICNNIILFFPQLCYSQHLDNSCRWQQSEEVALLLYSLLQCLAPLVWEKKSPLWQSICSILLNVFSNHKHILCSLRRRKYFTTCQRIKWFLWLSTRTSPLLVSSGIKMGRREEKKTGRALQEIYWK